MSFIYVVIENGEPYNEVYGNYFLALKAVLEKHLETIEQQEREAAEFDDKSCCDVIVVENPSGKTKLYIEKDINIIINKLRVRR